MGKVGKKKFTEESVLDAGLERTRECFRRFDNIVVSFSGGKDSTVVFQLALQVAEELGRLPLTVVFFDEEAISPETEEYCRRVSQMPGVDFRWLCLPVSHRNGCSRKHPHWWPWDPKCPEKWVRPLPPEAITEIPGFNFHKIPHCNPLIATPAQGMTCVLTGVRAAESIRRYQSVAHSKVDNYFAPAKTTRGGIPYSEREIDCKHVMLAKPVYDWSVEDVWVAPHVLGWDYNRSYDIFDKAGISKNAQRVAPPYGEEPMLSLWMWSVCWPELWARMHDRVSGAATAARYSQTELYSFGTRPQRPEGMTWMQYIAQLIQKFPPAEQVHIAERIKREMKIHNEKTGGAPLHDSDPNLISGLSWQFLAMVAMRGDLKNRKTVDGERIKAAVRHENQLKKGMKDVEHDNSGESETRY
jgi:predicted phosphoadenosine phosphosulfate sulfurtransferase